MQSTDPYVVALVATCNRPEMLRERCLPSIGTQSRPPDLIVIVDDSPHERLRDENRKALEAFRAQSALEVLVLANKRTKGASGAWNTGILRVLGRDSLDPSTTFIAILDDDDQWLPEHLQRCLQIAEGEQANFIASAFERYEGEDRPKVRVIPPAMPTQEDFFRGNPGIQGSNLFVRLDRLLAAGLFDEGMPSCTDRDLCIRLLDVEGTQFGRTTVPTVVHFAEASRHRLSKPLSRAKSLGLEQFFRKHGPRMTEEVRRQAQQRARRLFQWEPEPEDGELHLVVGIVADADNPKRVKPLLHQLLGLSKGELIAGLDVLVLENGPRTGTPPDLRSLIDRLRSYGLRCHLLTIEEQADLAAKGAFGDVFDRGGGRLPIATTRTMLQGVLYEMCRKRPGSVAWILDDDKRLGPIFDLGKPLGGVDRWLVPVLRKFRAEGADAVIGQDAGAAPLPTASTIRVQLLDLVSNLEAMMNAKPDQEWQNREHQNNRLREGCPDYYYDLSASHTDHVETPMWMEPEYPGQPVREAFLSLLQKAKGIARGEQVMRPLRWHPEPDPFHRAVPARVRGGCTFVLNIELLAAFPNPAPGTPTGAWRRSDTIWTILQSGFAGRRVLSAPIYVEHDRRDHESDGFHLDSLVEDSLGHAAAEALREHAQRVQPAEDLPVFDNGEVHALVDRFRESLATRLAAISLSVHRSEALLERILGLLSGRYIRADHWFLNDDKCRNRAAELAGELSKHLRFDHRHIREFLNLRRDEAAATFEQFLRGLKGTTERWRAAMDDRGAIQAVVGKQREELARFMIRTLIPNLSVELRLLGVGAESVVFTDETKVYKYLDCWRARGSRDDRVLLRSLVRRWERMRALYSIERLEEKNVHACLVYPYEISEPYAGGCGRGMITLLRECRANGIVFDNMHPKNLRVVGEEVKLIDYGSDIRPFSDEGFDDMCRRAYVCWRYANRPDLDKLLRLALTDPEAAEFVGWRTLLDAVNVEPEEERLRRKVYEIIGSEAKGTHLEVLDYGSGKAMMARVKEAEKYKITMYDPDESLVSRSRRLGTRYEAGGRSLRDKLIEDKRAFSVVLCNRVLCSVEKDAAVEDIIDDLGRFVALGGLVIVSICNPFFTSGGGTPERLRVLPADFHEDGCSCWEMRLSSGGRRIDVHRPLDWLRRRFLKAGLLIESMVSTETVDLDLMCPQHDYLVISLRKVALTKHSISLVIRTCSMEWETIEGQVEHLVRQLEGPRAFDEVVLAVDADSSTFTRQYAEANIERHREALHRLVARGLVDRILTFPDQRSVRRLNLDWFGLESPATHAANGSPVTVSLNAFEELESDYVLLVDSDLIIGRPDPSSDYLGALVAALEQEERAVTVSLPISGQAGDPVSDGDERGPWRVEVRGALYHRRRLLSSRPWQNEETEDRLKMSWYRCMDAHIASHNLRSLRIGALGASFIHPQNSEKTDRGAWQLVIDRVEARVCPNFQLRKVDLQPDLDKWLQPKRTEPYVFLVQGRNVSPAKVLRCLDSIRRQRGDFGLILFDDHSDPMRRDFLSMVIGDLAARTTLLRPRWRRGKLANLLLAVRQVCTDPETVIVTVDLDDALVSEEVLEVLDREYSAGADLTVGSMIRTDKPVNYQVVFDDLAQHRGGNVWMHLRTFRKSLVDKLPDEAFQVDGAFPEIANDWALMVPLVQVANQPRWIRQPLYFHEPSGRGKGDERERRERVIQKVMQKAQKGTRV